MALPLSQPLKKRTRGKATTKSVAAGDDEGGFDCCYCW